LLLISQSLLKKSFCKNHQDFKIVPAIQVLGTKFSSKCFQNYNDMKQLITIISLLCFYQTFSQTTKDTTTHLSEVVVTASRLPMSIMKSPVSIELLDARAIKSSPAPSYFEAIENLKGVQLLTSSLGFKVYNTRGFANPTNVRFVQLVDGADSQAPHIGAPIGSALAPTDLDIDRVELIPGTASALYGMNALNGMVQILSKNPFEYQGFLFNKKLGSIIWAMPMLLPNFLPKPPCVGQKLGIINGQ
jgi:outer membrane cobalamin receptor